MKSRIIALIYTFEIFWAPEIFWNISKYFDRFQINVAFHIETSHLIYIANQMTCFYMKYSTELNQVNMEEIDNMS